MRIHTLLAVLICFASCDSNSSSKTHTQNRTTSTGKQLATTRQSNGWNYEAEESDISGAKQPVILAFKWGHVIIRMPNGDLKKTNKEEDWWFRPRQDSQGCGIWRYKKFGRKYGEQGMGHKWIKKPKHLQGTGVLPYAIKGLLGNAKGTDIVVIVSTGVRDELGVNDKTEKYLQYLKNNKKIGEYHTPNSIKVPEVHNAYVKAGKRVYTLLHTTC